MNDSPATLTHIHSFQFPALTTTIFHFSN